MATAACLLETYPPPPTPQLQRAHQAAQNRCVRLEKMLADPAYVELLISQGRYFRLCAVYAWASANEAAARQQLEADILAANLASRLRAVKTVQLHNSLA